MKILHLVDPSAGLDVLDTLALVVNRVPGQHQVLVLGHYGWSDAAVLAGLPRANLRWNRALGRWDPGVGRAVRRALADFNPSHLHIWGHWAMRTAAVKAFAGPRVASIHLPPSGGQLKSLGRMALRHPWLLITPWRTTYDALLRVPIPPARLVQVAPGAWSVPDPPPVPANLRRILGLQPREGPVLMLGGWSEQAMRHDHGIWAAAIVSHVYLDAWGLVRADPIPRKEWVNPYAGYQSFTRTLKDPQLIAIAPVQFSWEQLAAFADLFVFTPGGPAGMNSLLAAMAAGKPIVSTRTPQTTELLEDGLNALLAPPDNPKEIAARIHTILRDAELKVRLGQAAQATFNARCAPRLVAEQMASIYAQVEHDPTLRSPVVPPTV